MLPGAFAPGTTYTILNTEAGVSGTFSGVTTDLVSAFLAPTLSYDANNVFLTIAQIAPFASAGGTANQIAAAGGSNSLGFGNSVYDAVLMSSAPQARQAFDALSGELHASTAGVLVDDSRYVRDAVLGRLRRAPFDSTAGPLAALGIGGPTLNEIYAADLSVVGKAAPFAPPPATPLTFWAQGFGGWGNIEGNGNAANVDRNLGGAVFGVDGRVGAGWRLGLAAGYSQSNISVDARQSSATVTALTLQSTAARASAPGTCAGAPPMRTSDRHPAHDPGLRRTTADYDGGTGQIFGELGYGFALGRVAIEPFAGLAWVHVNTDGFTEAGSTAALTGLRKTEQVGYSSLGARFATVFALANGMALTPRVSAAWQHAFGDVTPAASLAFASGSLGFGITGVPLARDSALLEAGADLRINASATLGISYLGQLNARDHAIKGKFVWNF